MSTIKSSSEHLTLNADGASKDIKFQANGVEKASIDSSGNLTVSGGVTTTGARSFFAPASENFGIGVKHVTGGGALYFGASSSSSTPDGGIYNSGGSQILGFGNDRNVTIPAGNLVIGTAGKGIDFSATSDSGGMTSEVLDDYEEGSWTPSFLNGTPTYTTVYARAGKYVKIGTMCFVWMELYAGSISFSDSTAILEIGTLPFTGVALGNTFGMQFGGTVQLHNMYTNGSTYNDQAIASDVMGLEPYIAASGTSFKIAVSPHNNQARSFLRNAAFHNGSGLVVGFCYQTT